VADKIVAGHVVAMALCGGTQLPADVQRREFGLCAGVVEQRQYLGDVVDILLGRANLPGTSVAPLVGYPAASLRLAARRCSHSDCDLDPDTRYRADVERPSFRVAQFEQSVYAPSLAGATRSMEISSVSPGRVSDNGVVIAAPICSPPTKTSA